MRSTTPEAERRSGENKNTACGSEVHFTRTVMMKCSEKRFTCAVVMRCYGRLHLLRPIRLVLARIAIIRLSKCPVPLVDDIVRHASSDSLPVVFHCLAEEFHKLRQVQSLLVVLLLIVVRIGAIAMQIGRYCWRCDFDNPNGAALQLRPHVHGPEVDKSAQPGESVSTVRSMPHSRLRAIVDRIDDREGYIAQHTADIYDGRRRFALLKRVRPAFSVLMRQLTLK